MIIIDYFQYQRKFFRIEKFPGVFGLIGLTPVRIKFARLMVEQDLNTLLATEYFY